MEIKRKEKKAPPKKKKPKPTKKPNATDIVLGRKIRF